MGSVLRIALFGNASFSIDGQELRFKSLKLRAALGYIALNESPTETREKLVALLWSEASKDHARASLRQIIRELRLALRESTYDGLHLAVREIGFERGSIEVDVWAVIREAEQGRVHPLLLERANLADELLAGLDDLDPRFRSWLQAKRRSIHERLLHALETAMAAENGDPIMQGNVARTILNLDPTHEDAACRLMRVRAMMGDIAGALRVHQMLSDVLDKDHGRQPADAVQRLIADIKSGLIEPPPTVAKAAVPHVPAPDSDPAPQKSIRKRVPLFVQMVELRDVDSDNTNLVMKFRQHLIASLIRFQELQVADAPARIDKDTPLLGTNWYNVLMAAHQTGGSVQMTVTLKESDSGTYLWTQNFELSHANWVSVQRHVVQRIAAGLNVLHSSERRQRLSNQPDVSSSIYDRWLRCQTLASGFNPRHWEELRQEFTRITVEAPSFAPAYIGLADLHNTKHIFHLGVFRSRDGEQAALDYAQRAVELDPFDQRANRTLAWSWLMAKQYDQAVRQMEAAYELNPDDAWNVISVAIMKAVGGQPEQAAELAQLALDMTLVPSPTHWTYQITIQYFVGNYEAALTAADRSLIAAAGSSAWRAAALAQLGRVEEAAAAATEFVNRVRANWLGNEPPTDWAITKWMLHLSPIKRRQDWEHLRDGLAKASLPVDAIDYDDV